MYNRALLTDCDFEPIPAALQAAGLLARNFWRKAETEGTQGDNNKWESAGVLSKAGN